MENLKDLEARAQAAARSLAGYQDREREFEQLSGHLQSELGQLRGQNERLATELSTFSDENQRLASECAQLREEIKRLSDEDAQAREDVERLEGEIEAVRQERDRLSAVLEALIAQIELNQAPSADMAAAKAATAEVVKLAQGTDGDANVVVPVENDDIEMEAAGVVSALHEEFYPEVEAEPVANTGRLADRIRSVSGQAEVDRPDRAKNLIGRIRNRS